MPLQPRMSAPRRRRHQTARLRVRRRVRPAMSVSRQRARLWSRRHPATCSGAKPGEPRSTSSAARASTWRRTGMGRRTRWSPMCRRCVDDDSHLLQLVHQDGSAHDAARPSVCAGLAKPSATRSCSRADADINGSSSDSLQYAPGYFGFGCAAWAAKAARSRRT